MKDRSRKADWKTLLSLVAALVAARALFIAFMPETFSKDLYSWLRVIDLLKTGGNPYTETDVLNWPPFWMQVLYGIHCFSVRTGISPVHAIQGLLIAVEALNLVLVFYALRRFTAARQPALLVLFGLALNPIAILQSCQHCNFDVIVGFCVLGCVLALMRFSETRDPVSWLIACFCAGIGVLTKSVPLILTPLLFAGVGRQRITVSIFGAVLLIAPMAIGMSVIYVLGPWGVQHHVFGYRSLTGWYGIGGLLNLAGAGSATEFYRTTSPLLLIGIMLIVWLRIRSKDVGPRTIVATAGLLLMAIPVLGPGYSPTYILWHLPLLVCLYPSVSPGCKRLLATTLVVACLTYLVEYALFDSHGAFLLRIISSEALENFSKNETGKTVQTLIRLPLFVCQASVLMMLFRMVWRVTDQAGARSPLYAITPDPSSAPSSKS